jgi:hypothetical protein
MSKIDHDKRCNDCGVDVLASGDWYMATPELWERRLGLGWNDNLCIACLEKRLGRAVRFPDDVVPVMGTLNRAGPDRLSSRLMALFAPNTSKSRTRKRRRPAR